MACHGFGTGTVLSAPGAPIHDIARAISRLDKVAWAHVVKEVNWKPGIDHPGDPDIVFEMKENCVDEIERCVRKETKNVHSIKIQVVITVAEDSYADGNVDRHPPKLTTHSSK